MVAANRLSTSLKAGRLPEERELAAVQRERELPTRIMQSFQALVQARISDAFVLPLLRQRWLLAVPARFIAYGFCPPQLAQREPAPTT